MKTTKRDFEFFRVECIKWQENLGLINWAFHFKHTHTKDAYATTAWKTQDRMAVIRFCTSWDDTRPKNDVELKRLALHEVLHVLLAPLISEAQWRYTSEDAIDTAEHAIVRTLENFLV